MSIFLILLSLIAIPIVIIGLIWAVVYVAAEIGFFVGIVIILVFITYIIDWICENLF